MEKRDGQARRPNGGQLVGWVAIVLCGLLAFINAATVASSAEVRVLLVVTGAVLIGIFFVLLGRWFRSERRSSSPKRR